MRLRAERQRNCEHETAKYIVKPDISQYTIDILPGNREIVPSGDVFKILVFIVGGIL
jgi:hypothetical protein